MKKFQSPEIFAQFSRKVFSFCLEHWSEIVVVLGV